MLKRAPVVVTQHPSGRPTYSKANFTSPPAHQSQNRAAPPLQGPDSDGEGSPSDENDDMEEYKHEDQDESDGEAREVEQQQNNKPKQKFKNKVRSCNISP